MHSKQCEEQDDATLHKHVLHGTNEAEGMTCCWLSNEVQLIGSRSKCNTEDIQKIQDQAEAYRLVELNAIVGVAIYPVPLKDLGHILHSRAPATLVTPIQKRLQLWLSTKL